MWGRRVLTDHVQALFGVLGVDAIELLLEFIMISSAWMAMSVAWPWGVVPRGRRLGSASATHGETGDGTREPARGVGCQFSSRWDRAL